MRAPFFLASTLSAAFVLSVVPGLPVAHPDDGPDPKAAEPPANALMLEDLDLLSLTQDWGEPHKARSVENRPLTLGGIVYPHGVGTHATSEMTIDLKGSALRFVADAGVDNEVSNRGSCQFEAWVDGKRVYQSPVLRGSQSPDRVSVDLTGARRLRLVVTDGGDTIDSDHADWGGAMLLLKRDAAERPVAVALPIGPPLPIWRGPDSPVPAIHGPRVVGSTPGKPFLYRIPATGEPPLRFSARNLPDGISLDPQTGILTGTLKEAGTAIADLTVSGPKGAGHRSLVIVGDARRLALTPPLGWNSWNVWGTSVSADRVRAAADAFEQSGIVAHGFAYINIDDGWEGGRNPDGSVRTNEKFGDIPALADYVHARGLKLGVYSSPGPKTCAGYEGSFGHEAQDARTYAEWGVDYLKYDWCSYSAVAKNPNRAAAIWPYRVMQRALDAAPRDIVYSLCQYGMEDVWTWGEFVNGNCWRTTGDITDTWRSMSDIGFQQSALHSYAGPGRWNDPDMLVVGKLGWGPAVRPTRLTPNEQITHITLWSLLAAPLLIGCDLSQIDPFTKALLTNDEVLDVDQDPLSQSATRKAVQDRTEVWARPLFDGTLAVGLFNRGQEEATVTARWSDLGLTGRQPVRDLWQRKNLGSHNGSFSLTVPAHGAILLKIGQPERTDYVPAP